MAFQSSSEHDDVLSEINITPLVDVMLVLLVAFIVTAPLLDNAMHVDLPKTAATGVANDAHPVNVTIDAAGHLFIDGRASDPARFADDVAAIHRSRPEAVVDLRADTTVPYGRVAKAMATIQAAGVTRLSVLTDGQG
ncbi:MAG: biopolymer transporter ExbD [Burkholderia sp.]